MLSSFYKDVHYALLMGTRPQTLTGLTDSPVGLATFLIDHDRRSLELIARSFDGGPEGLTRDDVLDNATLFWLTNTGVSAARLYWEYKQGFFTAKGVKVPVAPSVAPAGRFSSPVAPVGTTRAFIATIASARSSDPRDCVWLR